MGRRERAPRWVLLWRNKWVTADAVTLDDMIEGLQGAADFLRELRDAGVVLEGDTSDDYAFLYTSDPAIAAKYGFMPDDFDEDEAAWFEDELAWVEDEADAEWEGAPFAAEGEEGWEDWAEEEDEGNVPPDQDNGFHHGSNGHGG